MSIEKRLTKLEATRPQEARTWIGAVLDQHDGGTREQVEADMKARWRAEHPDHAGEPLGVIVRRIIDPPAQQPDGARK